MTYEKFIWILEDDPGCKFVYQEILDIRYKTKYIDTLAEFDSALASRNNENIDFIIVDLRLKDGCFLSYLSSSNNMPLNVPFMIVSSIDDLDALRYCFDEGAIDYLVKPFKRNEFIAKLEKHLRDASSTAHILQSDTVPKEAFDSINKFHSLISAELLSELTKKEEEILLLFLKSKNNILQRHDLMNNIWKGLFVHQKTLDVHLYNLRKKLQRYGIMINFCKNKKEWTLCICKLSIN